jgi:hypothetical protein
VRLVMVGGTRNVWAWLEAETAEETVALQGCVARGQWTNGRGAEAIAKLRALAERLGYPVSDPNRPVRPALPCLVIVRHGERDLYEQLTAIARDTVIMVWDRRQSQRRTSDRPAAVERRRRDRRQPPRPTWATLGFLLVPFENPSP